MILGKATNLEMIVIDISNHLLWMYFTLLNSVPTDILFENILLDYARSCIRLEHKPAIQYYCLKAGGRGRKLLDEYNLSHPPQPTPEQTDTVEDPPSVSPLDESIEEITKT